MMFSFVSLLILAVICNVCSHSEFRAFTAGQDTHLALTGRDTVPFSKLITNHDVQFANGIFTCTVPGMYKFQVYALTKSGSTLFLEVYHNDVLAVSLWARTPSDYADAGNAVILNLQSGDTIQVKTRDQYDVSTYGTSDQIYTTITGILLGTSELGQPVIAFSAALTHHQNAVAGSPIIYNTVRSDDFSGYSIASGTYTAPSSGIYVFHFFSLARQDQTLWQELYHNGDYVCSIYGVTSGEYVDAGNTAIVHLKAGDRVQVRAHNQNNIYGAGDQIYSTFSGYQLVPESLIDQTGDKEHAVYFSAGLTNSRTFADNANVVFDRVFTDHGSFNHYDRTTGVFTAPYSGFYEFNYHALGQRDSAIWLELYHNNNGIFVCSPAWDRSCWIMFFLWRYCIPQHLHMYIDSLYSHVLGGYATGSNAAVVEMDAGDVAYIRAHHDNALYGQSGQVYCTFSGALLHIRGSSEGVEIVGK